MEKNLKNNPLIEKMKSTKEVVWINPDKIPFSEAEDKLLLGKEDIRDASERWKRFAPFLMKAFPETEASGGIIESPLVEIHNMKNVINREYNSNLKGRLLLKKDSHLAVAGAVKARGGIYEVLKHTETLALQNDILKENESYEKLADDSSKAFFQNYTIQVGSTGNLGLSIGIISAVIGYHVVVHMSADAKQWKKDLLRGYGVDVREYEGDYGEAVKKGRALSDQDATSYFVDDENSKDLFLGYAVAGERLQKQLEEKNLAVDDAHPLFVYLPCGVGGAPGGITFGLKQIFGDHVHCFFAEPVQAPCMLLGMATGLHHDIAVEDIGLSGNTSADGLAVGRASGFVGRLMEPILSGEVTVRDDRLDDYMRALYRAESIFIEPSACAAFQGPARLNQSEEFQNYLRLNQLNDKMENAIHIVWATGGSLVPQEMVKEYLGI